MDPVQNQCLGETLPTSKGDQPDQPSEVEPVAKDAGGSEDLPGKDTQEPPIASSAAERPSANLDQEATRKADGFSISDIIPFQGHVWYMWTCI